MDARLPGDPATEKWRRTYESDGGTW
jgi:hypothetical protein